MPYPIPLVIGGLLLGLIPGMPSITLNPDLVLLIFLPPLLYSSSFFYDLRSLRTDARVISLNAIGLTVFTAGAVGVIAHEVIDLPWAMSFALGAIVSPTDPAAATAIMRRVGAPRRMINVLEGESLINDATALVMYKVAVAAAIGETVSAGHTLLTFCGDVAGGIAIGLVVGYVIAEIRKRVTDVNTELTISLFSAYGAFIPADQLGVSGVLAVVTCGLVSGLARARDRLDGEPDAGRRDVVDPDVPPQRGAVHPDRAAAAHDRGRAARAGRPSEVVGYAALVCAAVILLRYVWQFTITVIIRTLDRRPSQLERRASWRFRIVGGWSGMRGAVSLAAALALPLHTDAGAPLPGRDLIQFITFSLILVTVVGEGLTLPWLIRKLGVLDDGTDEESEELKARLVIARAALDRVEELEEEEWTQDDTLERVRALYRFRKRRFAAQAGAIDGSDGIEERSLAYQRLMHEIYTSQRAALVELRNNRRISVEVMRRVERELDLEESRLEV